MIVRTNIFNTERTNLVVMFKIKQISWLDLVTGMEHDGKEYIYVVSLFFTSENLPWKSVNIKISFSKFKAKNTATQRHDTGRFYYLSHFHTMAYKMLAHPL